MPTGADAKRYEPIPAPGPFEPSAVLRDLGDGLVLRRASAADAPALIEFNRIVHADAPDFAPEDYVANWTDELTGGEHPYMVPADFTIVQDTKRQRIASSLCLLESKIRYEGIELRAGQPELVGTHPDYRRRGLVRAQFDVIHAWSEERGHQLQLIDGIPWYYRQFDYDMALPVHWRLTAPADLAQTPGDGHSVRKLETDDIPFLMELERGAGERLAVHCPRDEATWRYQLARQPLSNQRRELFVVENAAGERIGAFALLPVLVAGDQLFVTFAESAGVSWGELAPTILHHVASTGAAYAEQTGSSFTKVRWLLGGAHPIYASRPAIFQPDEGYAYYVRVPDLARTLLLLAPALESRLADSPFESHSGTLAIGMYRRGARIEFDRGRVIDVSPFQPERDTLGDVAFPDLTFFRALFGMTSVEDLMAFFPDCIATTPGAGPLASALFPPRDSRLWTTA